METTETVSTGGAPAPRKDVADLTRAELEEEVMWNSGGMGFGLCEAAGMMAHAMDAPGPGRPDLKSIVAVGAPAAKYTDEELRQIVAAARVITGHYDRIFRVRRGANLVCLDKFTDKLGARWMRKRLSWNTGPMFSLTLEHALALFTRDVGDLVPEDVMRREREEQARRGMRVVEG